MKAASSGAADRIAALDVPVDLASFRAALLLVQPTLVRVGAYVGVYAVVGVVAWRVPDAYPVGDFALAALLTLAVFAVRARSVRRQLDAWSKDAGASAVVHVELTQAALVRGAVRVPWEEVTDAAEVDTAQGLVVPRRGARAARGRSSPRPPSSRADFAGGARLS